MWPTGGALRGALEEAAAEEEEVWVSARGWTGTAAVWAVETTV